MLVPPLEGFYTGVGSRNTPEYVLDDLASIARRLYLLGYVLRSGGAKGADSAFASAVPKGRRVIYTPKDEILPWAFWEAQRHVPENLPPFSQWKEYTRRLIARNMMQVLGMRGDSPSEFLVCWTPAGLEDGGTGYALRCATAHGVPTYNLKQEDQKTQFYEFLEAMEEVGPIGGRDG